MHSARAHRPASVRCIREDRPLVPRGLKEAGKDDNVVIYTRKQQAEFDALKTAVEKPSRRGRASRRAPYAVLPMVASGAAI